MIERLSILIFYPLWKYKKIKIFISNSLFLLCFNIFFYINNNWIEYSNLYLFIYTDKFCLLIVALTLWINALCLIIINKNKIILIINLILIVILCISSTNIILFYLWFEIRLIPLFIIIFWWGKTKERYSARIYILIYTIIGSLPLILSIFFIYKLNYSIEWDYLFIFNINSERYLVYWNIIVAFLIKIPVFGFHIWLPKAHVEAPVYGSIILAAIILKLGGIGLIRIMRVCVKIAGKINPILLCTILIGAIIISLLCILQLDLKIIVAYSSVVHIGVATARIITLNKWGYSGAILLIISHGLCSSCIFFIVNTIYIRTNRRIIILNKGIINIEPKLVYLWFLTCIRNIGAPVSLNFIRELIITNRIIRFTYIRTSILIIINLFRRIYSIQLFIFISHGKIFSVLKKPIKNIEFIVIIIHILPINLISINSWIWIIYFYSDSLNKTLNCGFKNKLYFLNHWITSLFIIYNYRILYIVYKNYNAWSNIKFINKFFFYRNKFYSV